MVVAGVGLLCAVIGAAAGTCCAWLALPVSEVLLYEEAPRRYFDGLLPPVDEVDAMPDEAAVDAVPILLPPVPSAVPPAAGDEKNETLLLVPLPTWGDEKDTAARDVPSADNELLAAVRPSRVLLVVRRKGWAAVGSMLLPLPMLLMMLMVVWHWLDFCTMLTWQHVKRKVS